MYAHTHTRTHTHRHTSTHTLACGQNKLAEWKRRKAGQTHKGGKQSELYKRLSEWSLVSFRRHLSWPTSPLIGPKKLTLRMFLLVESLSHTHTRTQTQQLNGRAKERGRAPPQFQAGGKERERCNRRTKNGTADFYRFRSGIRIPEVPLPKSRGERSISTALGAQTIFQGHPLEAMTNGQRKTNEIK